MTEISKLVAKIKAETFGGSSTRASVMYHELPFEQLGVLRSHRKETLARWGLISKHTSTKDKSVLDLGCNVGAFSILPALKGASRVVGIDYDPDSIEVAKCAIEIMGIKNVEFICGNIDSKFIEELGNFDLTIWLSHWMWLVKQLGMEEGKRLLYLVSRKSGSMVFESASNEGRGAIQGITQTDIENIFRANTCYTKIKNVGPFPDGWSKRNVLIGEERIELWNGYTATVQRLDANSVRKTFKGKYCWMVKREEEALTRLKNYEHFPKLLSTGDNFIDISYCGTFQKGLDNNQCFEILKSLKEAKIIHRDVIPKNLLTKNGIVYLIDFGWCIFDDEQDTPVPSPHQLGGPYYNRVWNDENAMKICLRESNL